MSVNVENIKETLKNLGELSTTIEKTQEQAKETLLKSCDLVSDKVVAELSATAERTVQAVEQLQSEAQGLLDQADLVIKEAANTDLAENVVDSLSQVAMEMSVTAQQKLAEATRYTEYGEELVKQAQEIANRTVEDGGWSDMLLMTLIGFGVVFCVLVLLIFIMKGMGVVFTRQKKAEKVAKAAAAGVTLAEEDHHEAISDQEIAAAIITALKLYKSNLHDQESEMLTIHRITRAYSPWSSKIHGLTQLPERK